MEKEHILICFILVILVLVVWYSSSVSEKFTQPFYLNQIAMEYSQPALVQYLGREKDNAGMSSRDYYLENQQNYLNFAAPAYMANDQEFIDHTGYLGMPKEWRKEAEQSITLPMRAAMEKSVQSQ